MQRSAECLSSPTTSPLVIRGLKMLMFLTKSTLISIKLEELQRLPPTAVRGTSASDRWAERHGRSKILGGTRETHACKHTNLTPDRLRKRIRSRLAPCSEGGVYCLYFHSPLPCALLKVCHRFLAKIAKEVRVAVKIASNVRLSEQTV